MACGTDVPLCCTSGMKCQVRQEEWTACDNVAVCLPGHGQMSHDVEDECLSDATETSG